MNKNIKRLAIAGLVASALVLAGCKASDTVKSVVENAYSVAKEGDRVIDVITTKLNGSAIWGDVGVYVQSLGGAIDAIGLTLEKVAPLVGANLTTLSSVTPSGSTAELDIATKKLLDSIK